MTASERLTLLTALLQAVAATLALAVAWRRLPAHRPVAAFLGTQVLVTGARALLVYEVLRPARALAGGALPTTLPLRLATAADTALMLTWPAGLAVVALAVFGARRWVPVVAAAWAGASIGSAILGYRDHALQQLYLGAELAGLFVAAAAFVPWLGRRLSPGLPGAVVLVLWACDLALLVLGPWRSSIFTGWDLSKAGYCAVYLVLSFLQGGWLWLSRSSSVGSSR